MVLCSYGKVGWEFARALLSGPVYAYAARAGRVGEKSVEERKAKRKECESRRKALGKLRNKRGESIVDLLWRSSGCGKKTGAVVKDMSEFDCLIKPYLPAPAPVKAKSGSTSGSFG